MRTLDLRACPICCTENSLALTTVRMDGELYAWYQCQACASALLSLGDDRWAYQYVGRQEKAHLLKRLLSTAELQALLPQAGAEPAVPGPVPGPVREDGFGHAARDETAASSHGLNPPPPAWELPPPAAMIPIADVVRRQAPLPPPAARRWDLKLSPLIVGTMIANVLFLAAMFFLSFVKSVAPVPSPTPVTPTPAIYYRWQSAQVIAAFQQAGLEADSPRVMTRQDYGFAPRVAVEGTSFLIPSLCANCGGQVMSFDNLSDLLATRAYYAQRGAQRGARQGARQGAAATPSGYWLFVADNILVQVSGDLPADRAEQYQGALNTLAGTIRDSSAADPAATPGPAGCQPASLGYLDQLQPLVLEFADALDTAETIPLLSLDRAIQELQRIESAVATIPAPECARPARTLWLDGAGRLVAGFLSFSGREGQPRTSRELELGRLHTDNGLAQLVALAAGQPTPTPRSLPTATPIPTPRPTPTALRLTSPIVIGRWQVVVQKVDTAISITSPYGNEVQRADGRFALVFMNVTNLGTSADTFVAFASLAVQDADGRRYEENVVATHYAQGIYHTDLAVDVAPQQSVYIVAVFDVSNGSRFYTLVPGMLGDRYGAGVRLYIP